MGHSPLISDSDSTPPLSRRKSHKEKHRQVKHRIYHATEREGSSSPPGPPRIARRRAPAGPPPYRHRPAAIPPSVLTPCFRWAPLLIPSPQRPLPGLIATWSLGHLATLGLLPRTAHAWDVGTLTRVTPVVPSVMPRLATVAPSLCPPPRELRVLPFPPRPLR